MSTVESMTPAIRVTEAAAQQNGWRVILFLENEFQAGSDQNGLIAFARGESPLRPAFGYASWARSPDGDVRFFWGHYDLERTAAISGAIQAADLRNFA